MKTLMTTCFALLLGFMLMPQEAEAKRLGGGSSFGKSYNTAPKRVAPAPNRDQAATPAQNTPSAAGRGGMGGLMGGLLAGGLLAALFMGGAFDGIQLMDIVLLAVIGFVLFKLFSRKRVQSQQPAYAMPDGAMARQAPEQPRPVVPEAVAGSSVGADEAPVELKLPQWFNEQAFVEGARNHFMNLQQAWDSQNWDEIRDYMSDEMFAELQRERAKLPAQQQTEVESVMAELVNFIDNDDHVVASIHFYGWIAESGEPTAEFSEIWHLNRDMTTEGSDWKIVGIEQSS
jgi:predicted lipid-binding transport protein (Tim44 family)